MPLRHNIIGQTQPQTRSLPSGLGGKKRLEDFVFDRVGDAVAVVFDGDFDGIVQFFGTDSYGGLVGLGTREGCRYDASTALSNRIKRIINQIQQHSANVLRDDFDFR